MKQFSLVGFAGPKEIELKNIIEKYYNMKNEEMRENSPNENYLNNCEVNLAEIYEKIWDNDKWQKAGCFKSGAICSTTNLSLFNQEIKHVIDRYKAFSKCQNVNFDSVIKNLAVLRLAEAKTDCALSYIAKAPRDIGVFLLDNHKEYKSANKVYVRLGHPQSLRYVNRQKKIHKSITPNNVFVTDPSTKVTTKVSIDFAKDPTIFDKESGIDEIKKLDTTGEILEISDLNKLSQLLGKSVASPFVSLDSLPEHDKDKCCPRLLRCCLIL